MAALEEILRQFVKAQQKENSFGANQVLRNYAITLLAAFPPELVPAAVQTHKTLTALPASDLVDPLSERELEILKLLAAVRMFSKAIALECAQNGDNIRVNTVSPGGVMAPMWESMGFWQDLKAQTGSAEASWQAMSQDVPLKRFASPEDVAAAILYLVSEESAYVRAAELVIDGGFTA